MIDSPAFERLRAIGLAPAIVQRHLQLPPTLAEPVLMRVAEVQREGLTLLDGHHAHPARLLPALRNALAADNDAIAVGDWVLAERNALAEWWAHQRVPPLNQLARRLHDGRDKVTRVVIVSNVDTALLVMGLDHDFNLRRLQRYVVLAEMAGIAAVVVLTKADLCPDPAARLAEARAALRPGADAVAINALADAGAGTAAQALAPWLRQGQTLVLLGSSGAGKSTLTNALTGASQQLTRPNRHGDSRGHHTTTARSLHCTPHGACIIDTPGLRTLRLDGSTDGLDAVFDDVAQLALQCRFRDCHHEAEPGCAVRDGVGAERLRSYHKLLREARRDTVTALERKLHVQHVKARNRAAHARIAGKRD